MACRSNMVAIEFNGPSHYLNGTGDRKGEGRRLNGQSLMKMRLMRKLGWKVVVVPWFEYKGLRGKGEKVEYIKKKLEEA